MTPVATALDPSMAQQRAPRTVPAAVLTVVPLPVDVSAGAPLVMADFAPLPPRDAAVGPRIAPFLRNPVLLPTELAGFAWRQLAEIGRAHV